MFVYLTLIPLYAILKQIIGTELWSRYFGAETKNF